LGAATARNISVYVIDGSDRQVIVPRVLFPAESSFDPSKTIPFTAAAAAQYYLVVKYTASTTAGTYGLGWSPRNADGTFSSGSLGFDNEPQLVFAYRLLTPGDGDLLLVQVDGHTDGGTANGGVASSLR
jgi:hypothetical protein